MAQKWNRQKKKSRSVKAPAAKIKKREIELSESSNFRETEERSDDKAFLIVCEGQTEAAYFLGLCELRDVRTNFVVDILPEEKDSNEGYEGSTLKGLLYMAMELNAKAKMPYDETWIVTDNDEGNAFKLSKPSVDKIEKVVPANIYDSLKADQFKEMNVRYEKDKNRCRYFLSEVEYLEFLQKYIPDNAALQREVLELTEKREDFDKLYNDKCSFFYAANGQFLAANRVGEEKYDEEYYSQQVIDSIQVAYSCIAFEYWLLLHFEKSTTPFYNSREIIKYFDEQNHFVTPTSSYSKGWYLYEKRSTNTIKAFFAKVESAIYNSLILSKEAVIANPIKARYEINPYSDIHHLTSRLLNTTIGRVDTPIEYQGFTNLVVTKSNNAITISFRFDRKKERLLPRQIQEIFTLHDKFNRKLATATLTTNQDVIRTGDLIELTIENELIATGTTFLRLEEQVKKKEFRVIWDLTTYN